MGNIYILIGVLGVLSSVHTSHLWARDIDTTTNTSQISGLVRIKGAESELAGVTVELLNFTPRKTTTTDSLGNFILSDVPVGRHRLLLTKEKFEDLLITDIIVAGGQPVQINAEMEQQASANTSTTLINPVQTKPAIVKTTKDQPFNYMSGISARPFTIEEVVRYAGARFDPSRLIANFSGVSSFDDSRNDIIVRGNSPAYLQWQIEELPIENPNHLTSMGRTGGALPALNIFAMGKADFIKGSFAAQYGNTISGVFDIQLREGNHSHSSYMAQVGTQRAEIVVESPFGRYRGATRGGSIMVAGRASIGNFLFSSFLPTDPEHQDINFKVTFGKTNLGQLEFFGIGARSSLYIPVNEGSFVEKIRFQIFENQDYTHLNFTGLLGSKYTLPLGRNVFWRTTVGASYNSAFAYWSNYDFRRTPTEKRLSYELDDRRLNYLAHSYVNFANIKRVTLRVGVLSDMYVLNLSERSMFFDAVDTYFKGNRWLGRAYVQTRWNITQNLTFFGGINAMYATFSPSAAIDPRAALAWEFLPNQTISAGYAMLHQAPNVENIFFNPVIGRDSEGNDVRNYLGRSLPFMRSQHFDLEYNYRFANNWRLKAQVYAQMLDNVWVEHDSSSIFSVINEGATFYSYYYGWLEARGKGMNRGIEVSLEKFFSAGYYGLFSASLFDSRYKGSDGTWRNTSFNNRFIINVLAGREFKFGKLRQNVFFADIRLSVKGGRPYRPIDAQATYEQGFQGGGLEAVYADSLAFSVRTPIFRQIDIKLGVRLGTPEKKLLHIIRADLFNVFNFKNVFTYQYSAVFNPFGQPERGTVVPIYQRGFIPDITYMIQF